MKTITISYARTHLSRIAREVAGGESFVITKKGTPLVTFSPVPEEPDNSAPSKA